MERRFLDIGEIADYLKVKEGTVYVWVWHKQIPYIKMGRLIRFDLRKVEKWLEEKSIEVYNSNVPKYVYGQKKNSNWQCIYICYHSSRMNKAKQLNIRMSQEEKKLLEQDAQEEKRSISNLLLWCWNEWRKSQKKKK